MVTIKKETYIKIENWFNNHPFLLKLLKFCYYVLPIIILVAYLSAILYFIIYSYVVACRKNDYTVLKMVLIPFIVLVIVSIFRKIYNAKRPYELYNITPLILKEKKGESFPSRHVASAVVISMAFLYISTYIGIAMLIISLIIGITRVLSGVHFVKDVIVAGIIGVVAGLFMFL